MPDTKRNIGRNNKVEHEWRKYRLFGRQNLINLEVQGGEMVKGFTTKNRGIHNLQKDDTPTSPIFMA
jgi:hypothetical protein